MISLTNERSICGLLFDPPLLLRSIQLIEEVGGRPGSIPPAIKYLIGDGRFIKMEWIPLAVLIRKRISREEKEVSYS